MLARTVRLSLPLASILAVSATATPQRTYTEEVIPMHVMTGGEVFGRVLDMDGGVLAVQRYEFQQPSAVQFYEETDDGWELVHQSGGTPGDPGTYGASISVEGNRVAIGVPGGAARVELFERDDTGWHLIETFLGSSPGFGTDVDLHGERLIVGDPQAEEVRLYWKQGGIWWDEAVVSSPGASVGSRFGESVAITDWRFAVGAPAAGGDDDHGAVHVFERSVTTGLWGPQATLLPELLIWGIGFGFDVDIEGDLLAVGAFHGQSAFGGEPSHTTVFELENGTWSDAVVLRNSARISADFDGTRVDLEGDHLLVSGSAAWCPGHRGKAVLFHREAPHQWREQAIFYPEDAAISDGFGIGLAWDAGRAAVGRNGGPYGDRISLFHTEPSRMPAVCSAVSEDGICSTCPCGNQPIETSRGGCTNRRGMSGTLWAFGEVSASDDSLAFLVTGGEINSLALLVSGDVMLPANSAVCDPGAGIAPFYMDGLRCAGGALRRHGVKLLNPFGTSLDRWGGDGALMGPMGLSAGQSRVFQVFYRDGLNVNCGTGTNSTNGISVTVAP